MTRFPLLARLFICAIFVQGTLGKILGWSGQAAYMQSHNLPGQLIPSMLGIALVIEAAGVLCLIVGWQARATAVVMCIYLGVVSVLLHNFWAAQGMAAGGMQTQFLKNVGIMGGLLMIAAHGPGKWSVDEVREPATLSRVSTGSPQ
ncbi:MAG TPA: DoxX family protein [Candidatus Angelobacter sp.]|nr:DoxX family protein [Candidatus Angelobacter sp.]